MYYTLGKKEDSAVMFRRAMQWAERGIEMRYVSRKMLSNCYICE
jgi:hypothetical protein